MSSYSTSMRRYVAKRALQAFPTILGVIIFNFILIHLAPGSPVTIIAGDLATPEYIEMITKQLRLDRPLHEQLFAYIISVAHGDFGYSFVFRRPVMELIIDRMAATFLLMFMAITVSAIIAVVLGTTSAKNPYSLTDYTATFTSLAGYSLPIFWLGQVLILLFSIHIKILPAQGIVSLRTELKGIALLIDVLRHLVLPVLTLGLSNFALISRLTRTSMLEIFTKDFIVTARAKGLDETTVTYRHALRNAILPVVTVVGLQYGSMFAGAVMTETVFAWPGMGRLMYESIFSRDYPVLMGLFVVISINVIFTSLIIDLVYAFLNPRVRYK